MIFVFQSSGFHGFSNSTSTSGHSSSELPTSLGMLRYVFNMYSSRSRDLDGYYAGRVAARGRIKSSKVGCFAFWPILAIRRCVRPYYRYRAYFCDKKNQKSFYKRTKKINTSEVYHGIPQKTTKYSQFITWVY